MSAWVMALKPNSRVRSLAPSFPLGLPGHFIPLKLQRSIKLKQGATFSGYKTQMRSSGTLWSLSHISDIFSPTLQTYLKYVFARELYHRIEEHQDAHFYIYYLNLRNGRDQTMSARKRDAVNAHVEKNR